MPGSFTQLVCRARVLRSGATAVLWGHVHQIALSDPRVGCPSARAHQLLMWLLAGTASVPSLTCTATTPRSGKSCGTISRSTVGWCPGTRHTSWTPSHCCASRWAPSTNTMSRQVALLCNEACTCTPGGAQAADDSVCVCTGSLDQLLYQHTYRLLTLLLTCAQHGAGTPCVLLG